LTIVLTFKYLVRSARALSSVDDYKVYSSQRDFDDTRISLW